jgi:hypothetical protein
MTEALPLDRRRALHRRALWLEDFTVGWNVIEGVVAIAAGLLAGSVALIGFGVDSSIEVISALGLLWRLRKAGPDATVQEESGAERRALYVVAATFFLLAAYITYEAVNSLIGREEPDRSTVGLVLSVLSLLIMPALAWWKQRTGREMGSCALVADAAETLVCSYLPGPAGRRRTARAVRLVVGGPGRRPGYAPGDPLAGLGNPRRGPRRRGRARAQRVKRRGHASQLAAHECR